ncbi:ribonuclease T2 [Leucogyrophana mollusca]|uniref:Ribonuclease T2 n=1 Tax=Leucogyrophana mollusca TaxID=85980 RepID=A0ACB8BHF6_9AGAM|nr:ribonuclease T2 [Leucogyrophana mollusca]
MLPSIVLLSLLGSSAARTSVEAMNLFKRISSGCPTSGPASCYNTSAVDTCCTEYPGGLLLQTQFWDTNPSTGPSDSWTIHGLWPDNCDGTYQENCDPSRDYTDIPTLLVDQGASDTLSFMETYWVNINGNNEELWEHEWATHGTCYSTLEVACLPAGSPQGAEAVAFYKTAVSLFQTLPTYAWLESTGIIPSSDQTYSLRDLTAALQTSSGHIPALGCDGSTLNRISWYFNLRGSVVDGDFTLIDSPKSSACPSNGISYPPKSC